MRWVVWLLILAMLPIAGYGKSEEQLRDAELKLLRERMKKVESRLQNTQAEKDRQQQQLQRVETSLGQTRRALHQLQREQSQVERRIGQLKQQQQALHSDIDSQRELLSEQLRAAYEMGRQQRVKILLNQEQPERISRLLIYYEYFNQARLQQMEAFQRSLAELAALEQDMAAQQDKRQALVANVEQQARKLDRTRQQRRELIARLNQDIRMAGGEMEKLQADEKQLQNLLASIRQAINDIPLSNLDAKPFPELKGQLPWPLQGKLLNRYGSQRQAGVWDGVLIDAREGQSIRSISHGRVVFSDWLRGYGLLIIVDHGDGYMSLYAFNQSLYKEVGDWVHAGEDIAAAGASGGRDNAGLYFGIRRHGKPVNPAAWCRAISKGRAG